MSISDVIALGGICKFDKLSEVSIYLLLFRSMSITINVSSVHAFKIMAEFFQSFVFTQGLEGWRGDRV